MLFRTCLILIHSKRLQLMRGKGLMHVFKQFGSLTQHSCRHLKSSAKYSSASQLLKLMLIHLSYISSKCDQQHLPTVVCRVIPTGYRLQSSKHQINSFH